MNAANPQAKSIFGQALAIDAAEARAAYLEQACGGDAALRAEVESLLAALEGAGDFLKQPAAAQGATVDSEPGADQGEPGASATGVLVEAVGNRIGPYKLLQQLGEGGMGTVWVAEQTEPVRRRVALKVIKPGMDSAQVLRRFEAERQALALMDHSHIARVFDAGTTATGRPYFVMELVKGVPITRYCDELHLPIRERLALFIPVCQAIQHAHQKGIIHRDVKPSNVLVCIQDGQPVAKVIDFGIAKALHQKLSEQSLYTEIGQVVGTLQYMSPEQAELSALDIDTRADVYALGVLLYELLTGSTPLERKRLKNAAMLELLRLIREEEPPRPSTRLTDSKEALASLAVQRRTEPGRLTKEVRGELDWIVMKCLEKNRTQRYEAASGLARDLERYLRDETVEACPPSTRYRLRKLLLRHKGPVAAAAAVFLVLLTGAGVSTWQAVRASRAEAEARQQRDEAETARKAEIEQRLAAVTGLHNLAGAYQSAGKQAEAIALLEKVRETCLAKLGPEHPHTLTTLTNLAWVYLFAGKQAEAIALFETVRDVQIAKLGPDHPDTLITLDNLALAYQFAGKTAEAIPLLEKVRDARISKLGSQHPATLATLANLAGAYRDTGRMPEAIPLFEKVRAATFAKRGPDHPDTLATLNSLAGAYLVVGKTDEAIALYEKVRDVQITKLGPDHSDTLSTLNNLAGAYQVAGKTAEAIALLEKVRDTQITKLGPDHPHTLTTLSNLAAAYKDAGKTAEAITLFEKVRKARSTTLGPEGPDALGTLDNLAMAYLSGGRTTEAIALLEKVRDARIAKVGPDHPDTLTIRDNLAMAYLDAGRTAEAIGLLEKVRDAFITKLGPDHPLTLTTLNNLAVAYQTAGRMGEAIALFEKVRDTRLAMIGPDNLHTLTTLDNLAAAYRDAGRTAEAIALFVKVRDAKLTKFGRGHPRLADTLDHYGRTLLKAGKSADAEPILRECLAIREKKEPDAWTTYNTKSLLGGSLLGQKKYADAEPLLLAGYEGMKQREAKVPAISKDRLTNALERLVQLYEATGKKDKADQWRKKLEEAKAAAKMPEKK